MGDEVTYVVTRNINFTNVCYTGCRFCAYTLDPRAGLPRLRFEWIADRARGAVR